MLTEKQLILRLKNGDTDALKTLMQLYQDFVYTLVLRMVKSAAAAEELTQDIFIKVYKKINTFSGKAKFSTWLYTIAYRTGLNFLEKKKIVFSISDIGPESDEGESTSLLFDSDTVEEDFMLEGNDLQKILWSAIDTLPVTQGVVITLHYLQQFSIKEISELLGTPINTIKTHLFRGRNSMKSLLLKNYSREELL
jgi:RNA polymerase sigma-70 factor, ECF subfamily